VQDDEFAKESPDGACLEDAATWCFTAVGLNGRTRVIRVDRLGGSVRLLFGGDRVLDDRLPALPSAFAWNAERRSFEPIDASGEGF
jgi:hypothetical protein